jgi:hypothetical protein
MRTVVNWNARELRMRTEINLSLSESRAARAANSAVSKGPANGFLVRPRRERNPDRSVDVGFVAELFQDGRLVGFA